MQAEYQRLLQNANVGRVRLVPSAVSLHPQGPAQHDDVWLPTAEADGACVLHNCSTGHFVRLTPRDVVRFAIDNSGPKDGFKHFRLVLRRGLWMRGARAGWYRIRRRLPRTV